MTTPLSARARTVYAVAAGLAWLGLAVSLYLNLTGFYEPPTKPSAFGYARPDGLAGVVSTLLDWLSYFTILSNLLIAVMSTRLARGSDFGTRIWQALRLDSVLMITVTGVVFALLLAATSVQRGLDNLSNALLHQVTPTLGLLLWVVLGPRGRVSGRTVLDALILPLAWLLWTFGRGAVLGAYPYGFIDVTVLGYPTALGNAAGILVAGLLLAAALLGVDRLMSRVRRDPIH